MLTLIYRLIDKIILFLEFLIILDALLSWVIVDPYNKYRKVLGTIVNPILDQIRMRLGRFVRFTFIDLSPLIAILLLEVARILLRILFAIFI